MAGLSLKHIYKEYVGKSKSKKGSSNQRFGDFMAVKDFSLEIEDGEFIVFVGPSGCGKSTTLRMIAGLEEITSGQLYIDGKLVNDVTAKDRDIAMVFQNYALYPHLNAYDNISFGLKMRKIAVEKTNENGEPVLEIDQKRVKELRSKVKNLKRTLSSATEEEKPALEEILDEAVKELEYYSLTPVQAYTYRHMTKAEIDEKVKWAADILGINDLLFVKPSEMSGGQRQRIALGRAMVRGPKVFLLDEPLSNLDAKLRTTMRSEIVKLHKKLKTTFIYVTHDQIEAMTMGTRIVVMKDGVIQQTDTPTDLFDYPENKFVAGFIGTPQMNFFDVTVSSTASRLVVKFPDGQTQSYPLSEFSRLDKEYLDGKEREVVLGVRGENIYFGDDGIEVTLSVKEVLGNTTQLFVKMDNDEKDYIICAAGRNSYEQGDLLKIKFDVSKMYFFDKETERSLLKKPTFDRG